MVGRSARGRSSARATAVQALQYFVVGAAGLVLINSAYSTQERIRALDASGILASVASDAGRSDIASSQNNNVHPYFPQQNNVPIHFPLGIPEGEAEPLPSIRVEKEEVTRGIYGGKGDKKHLGGFTAYDGQGVSPAVWKHMITDFGVKSLMDVGCGKGVSTLYFAEHGVDVLCVEGSHDAVQQSLLPDPSSQVVEHDFSRGPYWPGQTYDAVWSVEFLEHVGRNYQYNYVQAFRKAALIFVSHSHWGGWHHVEVHDNNWWITRFESFGFKYSDILTEKVRQLATQERNKGQSLGPDGKKYNAQHIWLTMQVFINPVVAALPQHAHLFSEHGCYKERTNSEIVHRECGAGRGGETESKIPDSFYPLTTSPEKEQAWLEQVKASINIQPPQNA